MLPGKIDKVVQDKWKATTAGFCEISTTNHDKLHSHAVMSFIVELAVLSTKCYQSLVSKNPPSFFLVVLGV